MARRVKAPGASTWAGDRMGLAEVRARRGRRKKAVVDEYCIFDCVERNWLR